MRGHSRLELQARSSCRDMLLCSFLGSCRFSTDVAVAKKNAEMRIRVEERFATRVLLH